MKDIVSSHGKASKGLFDGPRFVTRRAWARPPDGRGIASRVLVTYIKEILTREQQEPETLRETFKMCKSTTWNQTVFAPQFSFETRGPQTPFRKMLLLSSLSIENIKGIIFFTQFFGSSFAISTGIRKSQMKSYQWRRQTYSSWKLSFPLSSTPPPLYLPKIRAPFSSVSAYPVLLILLAVGGMCCELAD